MFFVIGAIFLVAYLTLPKQEQMKPSTFEGPTADDGRALVVIFGTREVTSPNSVWYGDIRTKAIKKKGGKK